MKKISKFQIIFLAVFVVFIVAGVIAFARFKGATSKTQLPAITVWGTFPATVFNQYLAEVNSTLAEALTINYSQIDSASFSQTFVSALARGTGPDAILIPADNILPQADKLALIPYTLIPQRTFLDSYIGEASLYLSANGTLAIPFTVDPLVMYWNRDTFNAAGLASHPYYWGDFSDLNTRLTTKDQNGNIRKSAVALGEFSNITNAREILGTLFLQLGNPVTAADPNGGTVSTLKLSASASPAPALTFFTQFTDPTSPNYSWNNGLPLDKSAFLSGTLATYFGFASELKDIRAKNPNLNFDVAAMPQLKTGGRKADYGRMYGFSLVNASANKNAAFAIISILTSAPNLLTLSHDMYLPTVRIDAIAPASTDPYMGIFNDAALTARAWLDVDSSISGRIMANTVSAIVSGQMTMEAAIEQAGNQYDLALKQALQ